MKLFTGLKITLTFHKETGVGWATKITFIEELEGEKGCQTAEGRVSKGVMQLERGPNGDARNYTAVRTRNRNGNHRQLEH